MEEKEIRKFFWTEASKGGLFLGLALFVISLISYYFDLNFNYSGTVSIVQVVVISWFIYHFGRNVAVRRGDRLGFTYGQAMGFVLAMMLFTGIIFGVGEFFLQSVIDPEYYRDLYEAVLHNSTADEELIEKALEARALVDPFLKNPLFMVISGVLSMILYGGFVGLIISAFLKRPADPNLSERGEEIE